MQLNREAEPPTNLIEVPGEVLEYVETYWPAQRISIAIVKGKAQRSVNRIDPQTSDTAKDLARAVADICERKREDLGGAQKFAIKIFQPPESGESELRQRSPLIHILDGDAAEEDKPEAPANDAVVYEMLRESYAQNRFLVTKLVQVATTVPATMANTIESLSSKATESLHHLEVALRTQLDATREEKSDEARAQAIAGLTDVLKAAAPEIMRQVASRFLSGKTKEEKTEEPVITTDQIHNLFDTLSKEQWEKVKKMEHDAALSISRLASVTNIGHATDLFRSLWENPKDLLPLREILTDNQMSELGAIVAELDL